MGRHLMKIAILTSSRADYGVYLPLLKALDKITDIDYEIIAFGTHLSPDFGYTIDQIKSDGFKVLHTINALPKGDTPYDIATAISLTMAEFAKFWEQHSTDYHWVLCLGDRYEMFAAVTSGIPFGIKFAHIHGGETTLGAMDNIFRNNITHASTLHFTSCEQHKQRVEELISGSKNVFNVGALSLENLATISLFSIEEFKDIFSIDLTIPTILTTVHPETIHPENNRNHIEEFARAILTLSKYQVLITLPNADTGNSVIRERLLKLPKETQNRVICVENLGTRGYFSAMKHCSFLMGNTSSGIVEAASFGKFVINIGERQKGRICGGNVIHIPFNSEQICQAVKTITGAKYKGENLYFQTNTSELIIQELKKMSIENI
jgi:GDP/UDP-N,N'-diacetylbacillosamine 2-epimerase (hydrolysing)